MRTSTRMVAAAAVAAAIAAGSTAAVAATTGAGRTGPAKSIAASAKPGGARPAGERQGHDAMTAAVAGELHLSAARVGAALRPLFAAGRADTSSPAFAAAARSLGVSTQQLNTALMRAKQSLAAGS